MRATRLIPGRPRPLAAVPEEDLRARLCARDERALAELIERASPWLLGLVQGMLGDPDEAEDVVIDTFRVVWEKVQPVTADSRALLPWVLHIARNRAIDRLRARRRRPHVALEAVAPHDGELAVHAAEPNEAASPGWHVHRRVHAALGELPEPQRHVVRLAYFEGLTHSEIAQRLQIPLGTVKTRLRLAVDRLRGALRALEEWTT